MVKATVSGFIKLVMMVLGLTACSVQSNDARLQRSAMPISFTASQYRDFQDYIVQTRAQLKRNKLFSNKASVQTELDVATPFEILPPPWCNNSGKARKGILLIHGLGDVPFMMRDMGEALADRCFLVRSILLPGHGSRPGDLLDVTYQDWLNAVQFGVDSLKSDVGKVFVSGFSLGGLLAVNHAANDEDIRGVIAFSPALQLPWMASQLNWLKHIIQWGDIDIPQDYARYSATPVNAIAQIYPITQSLQESLDSKPITAPVFVAQSADDPVVNWESNQAMFTQYFINPASKLITYRREKNSNSLTDSRISYLNSHVPEARVYSYSHLAIHVSPENPHYGVAGDYRFCDEDLNQQSMRECQAAKQPWRGEIYQQGTASAPQKVMVRLTYNPKFDELLSLLDSFLETNL